MEIIYYVILSTIIICLAFYSYSKSAKCSALGKALYDEQELRSSIASRELQRSHEFDFVLEQSLSMLGDIIEEVRANKISMSGGSFEFIQELESVMNALKNTPPNYLSSVIGDYDLDVGDHDYFDFIKERAPELSSIRYIELLVVLRVMLSARCPLSAVPSMMNG